MGLDVGSSNIINESTHIPLVWFFGGLVALVAGIFALSYVFWQTRSNTSSIEALKIWTLDNQKKFENEISDLKNEDKDRSKAENERRSQDLMLLMTIREDVAVIKAAMRSAFGRSESQP